MTVPLGNLGRPAVILIADDDEDHVCLTRMAFEQGRLLVDLHAVADGEECLRFLRKQPPYADTPNVDLLLLDLNMPRMDGYEVMAAITADEALRATPVVVLTTSASHLDVKRMHELRCNSYIVKPVSFDSFVTLVQRMAGYWFKLVVLPTGVAEGDAPRI